MKKPYVYILANKRNGTLYTGITSALPRRIAQHKADAVEGFSKRYSIHILVWYEAHETMTEAIIREKAIKKWNRAWKLRLIHETNPDWRDLSEDLIWF